ncbi:hypothetical protein BDP81DRAFT_437914 [Colletotrichum phormii]|uniref:Uncharacterized protein n=1 Tax=Colletotrichum phormii TaxID=359342 RepID=A0AAJ0E9L5_9PEZI|nr:uncharacterized protein BDP81DRAFT_437914 [Colletotrichum phormii]KAK1624104.1 hypothetical protein BDP81DRAFT_437914 [Colletotrichum phormii]
MQTLALFKMGNGSTHPKPRFLTLIVSAARLWRAGALGSGRVDASGMISVTRRLPVLEVVYVWLTTVVALMSV